MRRVILPVSKPRETTIRERSLTPCSGSRIVLLAAPSQLSGESQWPVAAFVRAHSGGSAEAFEASPRHLASGVRERVECRRGCLRPPPPTRGARPPDARNKMARWPDHATALDGAVRRVHRRDRRASPRSVEPHPLGETGRRVAARRKAAATGCRSRCTTSWFRPPPEDPHGGERELLRARCRALAHKKDGPVRLPAPQPVGEETKRSHPRLSAAQTGTRGADDFPSVARSALVPLDDTLLRHRYPSAQSRWDETPPRTSRTWLPRAGIRINRSTDRPKSLLLRNPRLRPRSRRSDRNEVTQ